jgi:hypothetical protein
VFAPPEVQPNRASAFPFCRSISTITIGRKTCSRGCKGLVVLVKLQPYQFLVAELKGKLNYLAYKTDTRSLLTMGFLFSDHVAVLEQFLAGRRDIVDKYRTPAIERAWKGGWTTQRSQIPGRHDQRLFLRIARCFA